MRAGIHPEYKETVVRCTCGAEYRVRSTKQDLHLGVCAACHPFFTGQQRFVDTARRVEKLQRRFGTGKLSEQVKKPQGQGGR